MSTVIKPTAARVPAPPFTPEHEELRETCRRFVATELAPHAARWEEERWFPDEVFHKMADAGLLGLKYPEALGGQGGDYLHDAVLTEELARCGSGGLAAGIGAHIGIATPPVFKFGTPEQQERWLAPAIRGESIAALAITEPDAGSDVAGIRTRAERVDGGWLVNGSKMYITNGVRAGFWVTAVKTNPDQRHAGVSFLVIEPQEGISTSKIEKLGWHASDTALMALRGRLRPRGAPARGARRRLQADHGQLPVGAAADGARRGRGRAGRVREDARVRRGALRVRAARSGSSRARATSSRSAPCSSSRAAR